MGDSAAASSVAAEASAAASSAMPAHTSDLDRNYGDKGQVAYAAIGVPDTTARPELPESCKQLYSGGTPLLEFLSDQDWAFFHAAVEPKYATKQHKRKAGKLFAATMIMARRVAKAFLANQPMVHDVDVNSAIEEFQPLVRSGCTGIIKVAMLICTIHFSASK